METIKKYMLFVAFFMVPFSVLSLGLVHKSHHYAIVVAGLLIMASMMRNNFIAAFGTYLAAWQVFLFLYVMTHPQMVLISANGFAVVCFVIVGFAIFMATSRSKIPKEYFYNAVCVAAIIQSMIAFSQAAGFDPLVWVVGQFVPTGRLMPPETMVGTLGNPNFLAAFIAISSPFFFRRKWWLFIPALMAVICVSMTMAAAIPFIIGTIIVLWNRYNFKWAIVAWAAVSAAGFMYFDESLISSSRWVFWKQVIDQVTAFWPTTIFGMGPGAMWQNNFPVHSEWVSCFHQFGIVGIVLMAGYVFTVLRRLRNTLLLASFVVIAVNLIGNSALHYAPTAFLICMIAGLIEREMSCPNT